MKKILSAEFDRALHDPRIWIVMLGSLVFFGYQFRQIQTSLYIPPGYSFADLWYYIYTKSNYIYFIPLAAAFPYADSMVVDRIQSYVKYMVFRSSFKNYLKAKLLINAFSSFCVIVIPLLVLYVFSNIAAPRSVYIPNTWQPPIAHRPEDIWIPVFQSNPDLFIAVIILLAGITGVLYAALGISTSMLFPNRYAALGTPFVVFVLTDFLVQRTNLFGPVFSPLAAVAGVSPIHNMGSSWVGIIINPLIILSVSGILILLFGKRQRILQ